jgi:hypothetical protein
MSTSLSTLSDKELREHVLRCHACFTAPAACRHHEDVVGGFRQTPVQHEAQTGRIAVVGVNPQASPGDRVYQVIQAAPVDTKMRLGDALLDVFAGRARFEDIDPGWGWMNTKHRGIREWLPRFSECLRVSPDEVADHFVFVEAFKHATADQPALTGLPEWRAIERTCPALLREQLGRLKPRRVVLCGKPGKDTVAPLLLSGSDAHRASETSMDDLHGTVMEGRIADLRVPVLFTYAISGQTIGRWRSHERTEPVRDIIRGDVDGGGQRA